jgi:hypothetical protein
MFSITYVNPNDFFENGFSQAIQAFEYKRKRW